MDNKPTSLNLTRKAIQSKPDKNFHLNIVGTAETAKAGYFELYKNKPHILFLSPELPDEKGVSFIKHALERVPTLRIVPMVSRLQNEQTLLDAGAYGTIQLPLQKAALWRKLDQLTKELNQLGALEMTSEADEELEEATLPDNDLFVLENPNEEKFNPIFQHLTEEPKAERSESQVDTPMEERVVMENETLPNPFEVNDLGLSIIDENDREVINPISENGQDSRKVPLEEDEVLEFNPFDFDVIKDVEEQRETPQELEVETLESVVLEEVEAVSEELPFFAFEDAPVEEITSGESANIDKNALFPFFVEDFTETEDKSSSKEIKLETDEQKDEREEQEIAFELPVFEEPLPFHPEEPVAPEKEQPLEEQLSQEHDAFALPELSFEIQANAKEEPEEVDEEAAFQEPIPPVTEEVYVEIPKETESQALLDEAQTSNFLYLDPAEYNKKTSQENMSFESGFYNRSGVYVPYYPPRDKFRGYNKSTNVIDVHVDNPTTLDKKDEAPGGLFSSVKKLFKK